MKFHFILEPDSAPRFLELGRLAESLGAEAVWTANHLSARDPFLAFSSLAGAPGNIRMGPVAVSPFELHPLKMANALLTLNEISAGRANIVVGGGGGTVIGMQLKSGRYTMLKRMVRGVRECVEFLKAAGPERPLDFDGELYQVRGYHPAWAPADRPRIYVGATKPQMLRMGAAVADGIMFSDLTLPRLDETMGVLRDGLARADRKESDLRINNLYAWHVKRERREAYAEARRKLWVRGMLEHWYISPFLDAGDCQRVSDSMPSFIRAYATNSPLIEGVPEALVDKLVEQLTFAGDYGDIDRLTGQIETMQNAGITEMGIRLYDDPEESMRVIAERVMPAFL